jgi:hypothetical protein
MLVNNQLPLGEHRHNYVRLAFLVGTLLLFIGYITVNQLAERGNNRKHLFNINTIKFYILIINFQGIFPNTTLRAEELAINDITPSDWVYRSLDAFNYLWQVKTKVLFECCIRNEQSSFSLLGFFIL